MAATPRASLCLRLSTQHDGQTGLDTQERDLRALAERHGFLVVATHTDHGISGARRDRPGWEAWLADAEQGRADVLMAWKVDRASRGGVSALARLFDLIEGVDATGKPTGRPPTRFMTYDGIDTANAGSRLSLVVMAEIAREERAAMVERITRHRQHRRQTGKVVGGKRPWPFLAVPAPDGTGTVWRPDPAKADAIRWAWSHLVEQNGTISEVAREWRRRGVITSEKIGHWLSGATRKVLSNPALYGALRAGDDVVRTDDGMARVDPAQAILSRPEWDQLQAVLAVRRSRNGPPSESLCSGVLHCSGCGAWLVSNTRVYSCSNYRDCPAPVSATKARVDEEMERRFLDERGSWPAETTAERPTESASPERVAALQDAIESLTRSLDAAEAAGDDEAVLQATRSRRSLRAELAELHDAAQGRQQVFGGSDETLAERWARSDVRGRNEMLRGKWDVAVLLPPITPRKWSPDRLLVGSWGVLGDSRDEKPSLPYWLYRERTLYN